MGSNVIVRDGNRVPVGLAPCGIKTVQADAPIPWKAIVCQSDMTIYFNGDNSKTWPVSAGTKLGVHPDLRLTVSAECLVF
ncbi:hypothetical protein [uncultured Desulfobacter sp.]|uniref:hypothetical protein n=1 Tax=uncultured Desulfobacter sp. TaxID=240139 RepID=UPI0029F485DF|nr:hypothetical protein [uncultured Desulfobacter sp.]